jgi:hypothetical protein
VKTYDPKKLVVRITNSDGTFSYLAPGPASYEYRPRTKTPPDDAGYARRHLTGTVEGVIVPDDGEK